MAPGELAGVAAAGAGSVRVEARSRNPLLPPHFFANRTRVAANLTTMLLSGRLSTSSLFFTFCLQDRLGISPLGAGLTMLPPAVSLIVFSTLVSALQAGGVAVIPAMVLIAAGMGFGIVGLHYVAVSGVTEDGAGIASGVQRAADQLGGATEVAVCVGFGFVFRFAPSLHSLDPFLVATLLKRILRR